MSRLSSMRPVLAELLSVEIGQRGRLSVRLPIGHRHHTVRLREANGWIRVEGRVADFTTLAGSTKRRRELVEATLSTNERTEMASLQLDGKGRLVAVSDLPANVPAFEVAAAAHRVARLADRWEELWTGEDRE